MEAREPHSIVILFCANLNFVKSYSVLNLFAKKLFRCKIFIFYKNIIEIDLARGVIKCALHSGVNKSSKN